jgi:3-oxoacyl-[acyl-carrier protein] reductase
MGIRLDGRVAIITGGANGIGAATARAFAAAGAGVAVWDMAAEAGQRLVAELAATGVKTLFQQVNVADRAAVDAAVAEVQAHFGRIDILVNNAGITRDAQFVKVKDGAVTGGMSDAEFDAVIAVNLKGV